MRRYEEQRAEAVRAPEPTRALQRARAEMRSYRRERGGVERRSMVRGLIVLAVVVLVGSIARAGIERVFVPGWWSCADGGSPKLSKQTLSSLDGEVQHGRRNFVRGR